MPLHFCFEGCGFGSKVHGYNLGLGQLWLDGWIFVCFSIGWRIGFEVLAEQVCRVVTPVRR
jgi:hypothetical protein